MEELWYKTKTLLTTFTHFQKRSRLERYGFAFIVTCSILLIKAYAYPLLYHEGSFLLLSFVVVISSWYGGLGPGLFSTVLATGINYETFLVKAGPISPHPHDILLSAIFLIEGLGISILSEARYETDQQKDEFIAYLAHELKNPLSAIIGFSGLITKKAGGSDGEKIATYSEIITESSNRLLQLISDLLDISKIEIGKFSYNDSFFNMTDLTQEIIAHQQIIAKNRIIVFKGKSKKLLYADKYRIGQVITNLITNAIKYSSENKKILLRLKETRSSVILMVKDYGNGITKKDQGKIFNRFYRANNAQAGKSDGVGLGLYICRQIVKRHNGTLKVSSKLGKGSTFSLEIPFRSTPRSKLFLFVL